MNNYFLNVIVSIFVVSCVDLSILNVYGQSIPYIVEVWNVSMINKSLDLDKNEIQDVSSNCSKALELYILKATNLTRCTLLNARPIHVCINCKEESNSTVEIYNKLQKDIDCHKFFFESDQIGIINLVHEQLRSLWSKNNCQNCYEHDDETQEFFKVSRELDDCMKDFNESLPESHSDTCTKCQELFINMTNIYKKFVKWMTKEESGNICMDIVDQMNITRHIWSNQHCLTFDSNIGYSNIVTVIFIGIIPILFYLFSKNVSIIEDVKLVRPKRKSYASLQESLPN